jgi:hypothetical protein
MKLHPTAFLPILLGTLHAQTVLIGHSPSIRNGGFEDANGTNFATTPFWDSYFSEAEEVDMVLASNPRTGALRGFASGYIAAAGNPAAPRVHPTQTIPAADWTIEAGDIFQFTAHARPGNFFDVGTDSIQLILHVVDAAGNPVPTNVGNADRIVESIAPAALFTAGNYSSFTATSNPVPPDSPWIGYQLRPRILVVGDRDEYAILDDIELIATRGNGQDPAAEIVARYPGEGTTESTIPGSADAVAEPGLDYGAGFGSGSAFDTTAGGATVPFTPPASFSLAFWMLAAGPGLEAPDLRWDDGDALIDGSIDSNQGFGITLRGPRIAAGVNDRILTSQSIVSDGRWHHIAFTRSPLGEMKLHVDGRLEDTRTGPAVSPADLMLGASRLGGRSFAGRIDDVHVFTGVLTAEEIDSLRISDGDIDRDGFSDREEAAAGTDWGSPADFPRIAGISKSSEGLRVDIDGRRSRQYQLERLASLDAPETAEVPDSVAPLESDTHFSLLDPTPPADRAFYRVRAEKGPLPKPNILLIVSDDQGYADISAFPNARPDISTPHLDSIAASGALLTQAYVTSPVCSPSRCGFLTGRMQNEWDPAGGWAPRLPSSVKHLAEYLKEAGYATAMIGKNDFGQPTGSTNNREMPTHHGFDSFFGFNAHAHDFYLHSQAITDTVKPAWPTDASAHLGKFVSTTAPGGFETVADGKWQTELFTDRAIDYLTGRSTQEQPFFLYLSHASVHALIHQAPKSYLDAEGVPELPLYNPATNTPATRRAIHLITIATPGRPRRIRTASSPTRTCGNTTAPTSRPTMTRWAACSTRSKALGLDENTIVIYFSDNGGEALTGANNQPLSGSKYTVFEGGLRVPMMIAWPGRIPAGRAHLQSCHLVPRCRAHAA